MKKSLISLLIIGFMGSACVNRKSNSSTFSTNGKKLANLLAENSTQSRSAIAKQIEEWVASKPQATDEGTRYMVAAWDVTRRALLQGALTLCKPEERMVFYRGISSPQSTAKNETFSAAAGTFVHTSISDLMRVYAAEFKVSQGETHPTVSPWDYLKLGERHTVEVNPQNSPFVSVAAIPGVASGFGDKVLKASLCPERAFSTPNQAWAESEFLPLLGLLPEEVVGVLSTDQASSEQLPQLGQCYAPNVGVGSTADAKSISAENFSKYNLKLLEEIEGKPTSPWAGFITDFLAKDCNCPEMVKRKIKINNTPYETEMECQ